MSVGISGASILGLQSSGKTNKEDWSEWIFEILFRTGLLKLGGCTVCTYIYGFVVLLGRGKLEKATTEEDMEGWSTEG